MSKCEATKVLAFDHISDEILISAADGELASAETAIVRAHLEACWHCRVRMEKIERAIEGLIDYRAALVIPYSNRRDGSRAIF
ncbi:MAG TPA: zf-HC2 domain-containing protein, partial [Candidatus Acidoferrum sp.]|nr:zf-HC2 domain-containing protein [Candidatus Acidoferrum sp.]